MVAHADEGAEDLVLARHGAQLVDELVLAAGGGQVQRPAQTDGRGQRGLHQRVEGVKADRLQHLADLGVAGADVPVDEAVGGLEGARGRGPLGRLGGSDGHYFASPPT